MKSLLSFFILALSVSLTVSAETPKSKSPIITGPKKWEKTIAAFETTDKTTPPPANGIEFVGSSTMVKWKTLTQDFAGLPVFNRGFGGSQSSDVLYYLDRVILTYKPKTIVFYAGDNDLAANKTADQVIATWKELMSKITQALPDTQIYYLSVRPSVKREALLDTQKKVNAGIKTLIEGQKNVHYVDLMPSLLGSDGKARADLLADDKLHLNAEGYKVLTAIVKPLLSK